MSMGDNQNDPLGCVVMCAALPRVAQLQPTPSIVAAGDCAACAIGGALGLSVRSVYERLFRTTDVHALTFPEVADALEAAEIDRLADRVIMDTPCWSTPEADAWWGSPSWDHATSWWRYIRLAIDAGHYAIVMVRLHGDGPFGPGGTRRYPNHWALISGVRERAVVVSSPGATSQVVRHEFDVLVSCSQSSARWVAADTLLRCHGGHRPLLVRPRIDLSLISITDASGATHATPSASEELRP